MDSAKTRITLSQSACISNDDNTAINLLSNSVAYGVQFANAKIQNPDNAVLSGNPCASVINIDHAFDLNFNIQPANGDSVRDHIKTLQGNIRAVNEKEFQAKMQQDLEANIMKMCREEFPEEWTVIQVSKPFCPEMSTNSFSKTMKDNGGIFVSILKNPVIEHYKDPLLFKIIDIDTPDMFDYCSSTLEVIQNMNSNSIRESVAYLENSITRFKNYVRPWSFLFTGKFKTPQPAEDEIRKVVDKFLQTHKYNEKQQKLIHLIARRTDLMSDGEINVAIYDLLENPEIQIDDIRIKILFEFFSKIKKTYKYEDVSCYPVILIVDEYLDHFPFEFLNLNQEMTRMSSFYLLKNLFLRHRNRIQNGYFMVSPEKVNVLLNPDANDPKGNLPDMESRLKGFYDYWLPKWKVHVGKPSSKGEIREMLLKSDIYMYHGHGAGLNHFSIGDIFRMQVNCVVFLFGCSSIGLNFRGFNEMRGAHVYYQMSLCPAIVGMLWKVFDTSCDRTSTKILSYWMTPQTDVPHHWSTIDQKLWRTGKVVFNSEEKSVTNFSSDNLLEVMSKVRSDSVESIITRAALVCRGLPTKCMKI